MIDRLEALVAAAKKVPLSKMVMVDDQEVLELVDQMRTVVPDEIRQAKRTLNDRDRMLADAQRKAEGVIRAAQEEADHLVSERGLLVEKERRGAEIIEEATREAEGIREEARQVRADTYVQAQAMRDGANQYAVEVLGELDGLLSKHLSIVRKGLDSFQQAQQEQQRPAYPAPPPAPAPRTAPAPSGNGTKPAPRTTSPTGPRPARAFTTLGDTPPPSARQEPTRTRLDGADDDEPDERPANEPRRLTPGSGTSGRRP